MHCAKILIVEDEKDVAKGIQGILSDMTCSVLDVVSTGKAALEKVKTLKPDVVLMDIILKGKMDGIETANKIRERFNIPVIYLTAYSDEKKIKRAKVTEPYGYILKPFQPRELYAAINMALKKHGMELKFKKEAKEDLKASEAKWRSLVKNAPNYIMILSSDHVIQFINRAAPGHSVEDTIGRKIYYFIAPEYHIAAKKVINRALKTGVLGKFESQVNIPRAGTFWFESHVGPIRSNGKITSVTLINVDVTERKRVEEEINAEKLKFKAYIKEMPDGVIVADLRGKTLMANQTYLDMLGYKKEEVLDKVAAGLPKEALPTLREWIKETVKKGCIRNKDVILFTKDKKPLSISFNASLQKDAEGKPNHIIVVLRDITERKKAEEKIRESNKRFNVVQRLAHIGNWHLDIVNNNLTWSDEIYRIFGLKSQKFGATYEAFLKTIHPDDRKMVDEAYMDHIKNKKPYHVEHRIVLPNSKIRFVEEICDSEWDKNGKPLYSTGAVQDITERKKTEDALKKAHDELEKRVEERTAELKESEEKYKNLFRNSSDMIQSMDPMGNIMEVNQAWIKVMGYSEKEVLKLNFQNIIHKSYIEHCEMLFKKIMTGKQVSNIDTIFVNKKGEKIYVAGSAQPIIKNNKVVRTWGHFRDVTEQKKADEALRKAKDELQNKVQELEKFTDLAVDRELKMVELKEEIKELEKNQK